MRIAYVIPTWPPSPAQTFVVNEMLAVQALGHELVVCALRTGPAADGGQHSTYGGLAPVAVTPPSVVTGAILRDAALTALTRPLRTLRTLVAAHRAAGGHPWAHARVLAVTPTALAAARSLPRLGVEHIHAHFATNTAECAAVAGLVSGTPYSFTAHAYDIYLQRPRHRNDTLAWKAAHAEEVVAISEHGADVLRAVLPSDRRDRVNVIGVGVADGLFEPQAAAAHGPTLHLLSVGRLVPKKGFDTLVDACALLRGRGLPLRLHLVGDGPQRAALEAQVRRRGLNEQVRLMSSLPQEAVAEEMRAAHAFVLPCRPLPDGDMDGIPTVLMEAMASGRPVVSCPVAGIPELVRDGETGLVVPSDDPAALADALERLWSDDALRRRLGAAGPAAVRADHDAATNAARLVALWQGTTAHP